jgi:hypothetical protein
VVYLLFQDLIQIYKVFYVLVTEILERFSDLPLEQAKKCFVVYQNFVNLTKIMQSKAEFIMKAFEFQTKLPQYYTPDASLVETLRTCVEGKQQSGLKQVSQQLRGGMNRNQFQTSAANAPIDSYYQIENVYEGFGKKSGEEESDSGEDFDYGEEEGADDDFDFSQQPKDAQPVHQVQGEDFDFDSLLSGGAN